MIRAIVVCFSLLFVALPASADDVERVILQYFDAMEYEDYDAAARLFDPEDIKRFRDSFAFMSELSVNQQQSVYEQMIGPWATQESVEKMSDEEFFASIFGFAMRQTMGQVQITSAEYLGTVMEGDELAHAVTRIGVSVGNLEITDMDVTSLARRNGAWKMKVSGDVERVAEQLKAMFGR